MEMNNEDTVKITRTKQQGIAHGIGMDQDHQMEKECFKLANLANTMTFNAFLLKVSPQSPFFKVSLKSDGK